jgi:hypothetical protein
VPWQRSPAVDCEVSIGEAPDLEVRVLEGLGGSGALLRIILHEVLRRQAREKEGKRCWRTLRPHLHDGDGFLRGIGDDLREGCWDELRKSEVHLGGQSEQRVKVRRDEANSLHSIRPGPHGRRAHDGADFIDLVGL